jgi:hypothetical protein
LDVAKPPWTREAPWTICYNTLFRALNNECKQVGFPSRFNHANAIFGAKYNVYKQLAVR